MLMCPYIKPKAELAPQPENILCYQRCSGAAGGGGWVIKEGRFVLKDLEQKQKKDVSHNSLFLAQVLAQRMYHLDF